jgi:hypothetical protein
LNQPTEDTMTTTTLLLQADPPPGYTPDTADTHDLVAAALIALLLWAAICYRLWRGPPRT